MDRDINTDPTSKVRLNRHVTARRGDVVRLNRLVQRRRALDRQIQEMGGPAPAAPTASGGTPPSGGTPAPAPAPEIPPDASPELRRLLERRAELDREIQRLNAIVDRDVNTDPTSGVRLNRHVTASRRDAERLNRLTQERRRVNARIEELQGQ